MASTTSSTRQAAQTPSSPVVAGAAPPPATATEVKMDARLLALAGSGSLQDLESHLNGQAAASINSTMGSSVAHPPSPPADIEAFLRDSLPYAVTFGGDTLLHVVVVAAGHGDLELDDFLNKASLVYGMAQSLLSVQNSGGDTPLHCAARSGNIRMVSLLIDLAGKDHNTSSVKALLEMENTSKWTVLHEAVRSGENDMVELLMKKDPELASLPKTGTSPLYLAILLENKIMAKTLYDLSGGKSGNLSYSGPDGQNALHAAVLRGKGLTEMVLKWNKDLTSQQDHKGSTPLHLVASLLHQKERQDICLLLLKANPDALYQRDNDGSFPTHVAASVGAITTINVFLKMSPTCTGLRDARGRTFLHVAVDKMKLCPVWSACRNRSFSWILNMQDNDGNTALHLAVQKGGLVIFCALLGNRQIHLNLTNEKGETPLDIAHRHVPKGLYYNQNTEVLIRRTLVLANAKGGIHRRNYRKENDIVQARRDEMHKIDQVKEGTQSLCIGSVLIATVTFGATFAMPGGYIADDHTNGGTPTLAGRYAFDAFILANALAFTLSAMATISLISSGSPLVHLQSRTVHLLIAYYLLSISVTSLVAAFALGTYMMLAPIAHKTAIGVCVLSSLVLLYQNMEWTIKHVVLLPVLCMRNGIVWAFGTSAMAIMGSILAQHWPIIIIFCSTIRNYHVQKVEPSAQSPAPLH